MLVASAESGNNLPSRQPIKLRGRTSAIDNLRNRLQVRLRENRQELLDRLRAAADEDGSYNNGFHVVARKLVRAEVDLAKSQQGNGGTEEQADLVALEENLLLELECEARKQIELEAEHLQEEQNSADCELYEQHVLGGFPCPLCNVGRLDIQQGELRCTSCSRMHAAVMDEAITVEMAAELLGLALERHRHSGCCAQAAFEVRENYGPALLFLACESCGWNEVVL